MKRAYKIIYEDIYKLHAKYGRVPPQERNDSYWESLVSEIGEYGNTHNDGFTTDMLVAVANELERECRAVNGYDK